MKAHATFSKSFSGIFVRDDARYWTNWIPTELDQESFIVERQTANNEMQMIALISVGPAKRNPTLLMVKDFVVMESERNGQMEILFQALTSLIVGKYSSGGFERVAYPVALFHEKEGVEAVKGLMYYVVDESAFSKETLAAVLNGGSSQLNETKHLFWDIDKF